jgi:pyrroline-5-carboxylate reductase
MLTDARLCFIGSGAMGEAMIGGLINKKAVQHGQVVASDPVPRRRQEMATRFGIRIEESNAEAAKGAHVVILCVKPQVLPHVLRELSSHIAHDALVLSIVAGARSTSISKALAHPAVVRSMPNTPAQVGEGMTVWTATPRTTERQRGQARAILQALGKEIYVDDEKYLDMATAVSGTGPAYVFLVMEALIDAAVHLGFSRQVARDLVVQTVLGSAIFAQNADVHMAELRNMVTSPGGTSAEALYQLEKGSLRTVLSKAVFAAYQRSVTLGDLSSEAMTKEPPRLLDDNEESGVLAPER